MGVIAGLSMCWLSWALFNQRAFGDPVVGSGGHGSTSGDMDLQKASLCFIEQLRVGWNAPSRDSLSRGGTCSDWANSWDMTSARVWLAMFSLTGAILLLKGSINAASASCRVLLFISLGVQPSSWLERPTVRRTDTPWCWTHEWLIVSTCSEVNKWDVCTCIH